MLVLTVILMLVGVGFCVAAFMGHSAAFGGAALCFFAATMIIVGKQKKQY